MNQKFLFAGRMMKINELEFHNWHFTERTKIFVDDL